MKNLAKKNCFNRLISLGLISNWQELNSGLQKDAKAFGAFCLLYIGSGFGILLMHFMNTHGEYMNEQRHMAAGCGFSLGAGIISGFLISIFPLSLHPLIGIAAGSSVFLLGNLVSFIQSQIRANRLSGSSGSTSGKLDGVNESKLFELKQRMLTLNDYSFRRKVQQLYEQARKLNSELEKQPDGIHAAGQSLPYYINTALEIIQNFDSTQTPAESRNDTQSYKDRMITLLDKLTDILTKRINTLKSDNYIDIDAELSVLEEAIEMEKLSD